MSSSSRPPWPDDAPSRRARALLDTTRGAGPTPEHLAELERGLTDRLRGGGTPASGAPQLAAIAGVAVLVLAVAAMIAWSLHDTPVQAPRATSVEAAPRRVDTHAPAAPPIVPRHAQLPPRDGPAPESRPRSTARREAPAPGAEIVIAQDEATLVDDARAALRHGDARRALELVARHERRFPTGELIEEREVVAIEALRTIGSGAVARDRAARFLERWPGSAYALRVRAVIHDER